MAPLPGCLLLVIAASRHIALSGTMLAAAGTATLTRTVGQIGFFTGLGVVIVFVAAAAGGQVVAMPSGLTPTPAAEAETVPAATGSHTTRPTPGPREVAPQQKTPLEETAAQEVHRSS